MSDDVDRYAGLRFWGPVGEERMAGWVERLDLGAAARVLDLGCGRGELLIRLAERHGVEAVGVDTSVGALALARSAATARGVSVRWVNQSATEFRGDPFDLVVCLGGPPLGPDAEAAAAALRAHARPGGQVLWGQAHWVSPPPEAYLAATGIGAADLPTAEGVRSALRSAGLAVAHEEVVTRAEWDHFEDRLASNVEGLDLDPEKLAGRRRFRDAQRRWGRDTMGFGVWLADSG